MQKRKFWEIVFQWVFPCALLVVALVLSIYEFNNKMNSAIQTVVDDQAEQIGFYYSAGVDDKLGALGDITSAMANIMASRPDRSDAFVYEKLDTIVKASNAYMSAYCATNGKGMLSDRREFDMSELNYYGASAEPPPIIFMPARMGSTDRLPLSMCVRLRYPEMSPDICSVI